MSSLKVGGGGTGGGGGGYGAKEGGAKEGGGKEGSISIWKGICILYRGF